MIDITKNTGFIAKAPSPSAWIFGGETGATKPILEPLGQWDAYLPTPELQNQGLETMGCTVWSAQQNNEILINRLRAKGLLPTTHEVFLKDNGYIDSNNSVNFAERPTCKLAGTTRKGTSLEPVGESIRKLHGLLPEKDWPFPDMSNIPLDPNAFYQDGKRWDLYYADVPQELQKKSLKFLDYFKINYEWVVLGQCGQVEQMKEALKYGPLQIASQTCAGWNTGKVIGCGCGQATHCTIIYGYTSDGYWKCFDHYIPFDKLLDPGYGIPWVMQYSIVPIAPNPPSENPVFHYVFNTNLTYGMPASPEVHKLQEALQVITRKDGSTYMKVGVFGRYGDITRLAVHAFQIDNGITEDDGSHFGPKTRAMMNAKLLNVNIV